MYKIPTMEQFIRANTLLNRFIAGEQIDLDIVQRKLQLWKKV